MSAFDIDPQAAGVESIESTAGTSSTISVQTQQVHQANRPHPRSSVMSHHHHHRTGKSGTNNQNLNGGVRSHQAGRYNHHRDVPAGIIPQAAASAHASSSTAHLAAGSSSTTASSSSNLFTDPFHTFDALDLQTPRAFVVVVGLVLLSVAGIKSYQHVANRVRQRRRLIESEKAAEELLRLNVKHGVVDLDGQVIKPGGGGSGSNGNAMAGTVSSGAGSGKKDVDAVDGKKRARSGTAEKDPKPRSPDRNTTISQSIIPTEKTPLLKPTSDSLSPTSDQDETANEQDQGEELGKMSGAAKNEAKKAKKKIKRAARLEQRKNSGDLLVVDGDDLKEGVDAEGTHEKEETDKDETASKTENESRVGDEQAIVGAVAEKGVGDEEHANGEVVQTHAVPEIDNGDKTQAVQAEEIHAEDHPAETIETSAPVQAEAATPSSMHVPDQESPMPFIRDMPSIEIQHVALPDSPPPSRLPRRRRASDVSDSATSLLSGASSGLSGMPIVQQHLEQYHASGFSTPSDQPQQKRKKKAKSTVRTPQRSVPGAENWVKESHEEKEREIKEQLAKQLDDARATSASATARASKAEKENETLTAKLQKLETKLSKVTSSQHDLREREKAAVWEREEANKRANEAQTVMQNHRKVEASLKHDLQVARKERDKTWQDGQRKEADLRSQLQQLNAQLAQAVHSAASFEAALRSTGRMPGTPLFGTPVPLMSSPSGLPHHHGHMLLGNPLPNQPRMSLSTPPSPQPIMSANGLSWIDRNLMASPGGTPSRKRSPSEVFGLPAVHPLSAATTPVRESSLAWTVLKNKGENTSNPAANLAPSSAKESSNGQASPAARSRSGTLATDLPPQPKDKENEPPIMNGVSLMLESRSMPSIIKPKPDADVNVTATTEDMDDSSAPRTPTANDGEEEEPFFVFPSIHHDPEHVKAAMAVERGRRASLQRATSGLSALASPSVSPKKAHAKKVELDDIVTGETGETAIYDQSSATSMTDSRGSTAFSSDKSQNGDEPDSKDTTTIKQPELPRVNESPEKPTLISAQ